METTQLAGVAASTQHDYSVTCAQDTKLAIVGQEDSFSFRALRRQAPLPNKVTGYEGPVWPCIEYDLISITMDRNESWRVEGREVK